eukprot:jgi/Pico_ML_1/55400/g1090.t1
MPMMRMAFRTRPRATVAAATAPRLTQGETEVPVEKKVVVGTVVRANFRGAEVKLEDGQVGYVTAEEANYSKHQRLRSGYRKRAHREDGPCLQEGIKREWVVLREGDERGPLLSAAKIDADLAWERVLQIQDICLEANETFKVKVDSFNTKGVITSVEGLRAFVPFSHMDQTGWERDEETGRRVFPPSKKGSDIEITIIEADQEEVKLVCSEEEAIFAKAMRRIVPGALMSGTVRKITDYGAFVGIDNTKCSGLLHVSNISQVHVNRTDDIFQVGERIKAVVLEVEENATRISLSTAELEAEEGQMVDDKEGVFENAEEFAKIFQEELLALNAQAAGEPEDEELDEDY